MVVEKAKAMTLKYLTYRPRSTYEVRQYLEKKGFDNKIIEEVISYLNRLSYLNDKKFCELWIKDRINIKPLGRKRIYLELRQKGIAGELIEKVLEEYLTEEIEFNLAKELINKKIKQTPNLDRNKIKRYLYQKGFSISMINKVLSEKFLD